MAEKTLPVVPSSWEEGLGVVEKNHDITYKELNNWNGRTLFVTTTPCPSFPKEGTTK